MTNEERIQKWLQRSETDAPEELEHAPARAKRAPERAERLDPEALSPARQLGGGSLEQARLDILARRQKRWQRLLGRLGGFVALPLLIVFLYVKLAATPLYQGEAVFTVQTSTQSAPSPTAGLFSVGSGG